MTNKQWWFVLILLAMFMLGGLLVIYTAVKDLKPKNPVIESMTQVRLYTQAELEKHEQWGYANGAIMARRIQGECQYFKTNDFGSKDCTEDAQSIINELYEQNKDIANPN
jgi:hypothetical protein